jgi:DNA-binding transcriptional LysR family regulator
MRTDLQAVAVFARVAQAGSFTLAAQRLGMPNSKVSAKVARLEQRLGLKLIERTTRSVQVTPAGEAYYLRCIRGLEEVEGAELAIRTAQAAAEDRIPLPTSTRPMPSGIALRPLISVTGRLWASAAYLRRRGAPATPRHLESHACLLWSMLSPHFLRLTDGEHDVELALRPRVAADDVGMLRELVLASAGVAPLLDSVARAPARSGALVRALPDWKWTSGPLSPAEVRALMQSRPLVEQEWR